MSCIAVDISGQVFGRLTVEAQVGRDKWGEVLWRCRCECGRLSVIRSSKLRRGSTNSCGCGRAERIGNLNRTHNLSTTPEYRSYRAMLRRCYDPKHKGYPWYGGRGIKVCEQWRNNFETFLADMGPRGENLSLDRISSDGDYEPSNCRWATWAVQYQNKRRRALKASG